MARRNPPPHQRDIAYLKLSSVKADDSAACIRAAAGNLSAYISGLGVFYADKRPTRRIGIIPDIVVTPTIAGIRARRDEFFEEAVRQIMASGQ